MDVDTLVVASAYGAAGASTRVRLLDWLTHLGIQPRVESYLGTSDVRPATLLRRPVASLRAELHLQRLRSAAPFRRLLIGRSLGPFSRGDVERTLLRRAEWGVYDVDDALWADVRTGVQRAFAKERVWTQSVRHADEVIAGNEYLAEAASALNRNVRVIPSCVEVADYRRKGAYEVGPVPRLIWMGSPSTESYLGLVAPALLRVHRLTGARLTVVSSGRRPLGALEPMVDRVPWRGAASHGLLADADCGIMPLPTSAFAQGKCAYKVLQYGAAGLPVVASPTGVNARVLPELSGVAATTEQEWVDALVGVLGESAAERRGRGSTARAAVERGYSFAAWRSSFVAALRLPDSPRSTGRARP
jgi:glycosyltransferase involved in cell wall biosynthesis